MRPLPSAPPRSRRRGSVLIGTLILGAVISLLAFSLLRLSSTEARINARHQLRLESRNAAEALAEYGFSQIRQKFETRSSFNLSPTGSDALQFPVSTFWSGSNVDPASLELYGGTINNVVTGASALFYVDPADQSNEFDPLKGKWVFRRDVNVIAKVTVRPPLGTPGPTLSSYTAETLSVRGAPLFAHAIFYNMDLELNPGPTMNVYGPVHANGHIYVSAGQPSSSTNTLNFRGTVTATGNIYHSWKSSDTLTHGTGSESLNTTAAVNFTTDNAGTLASMRDVTAVWKDSLMGTLATTYAPTPRTNSADFRAYASTTWKGNVQTGQHGIQNYTPVAIGDYLEDTALSDGLDSSVNSGRQIIEPSNWPAVGDPDYTQKYEIEKQKFANNAAVSITVHPTTGTITAVKRSLASPTATAITLPAGLATWSAYAAGSGGLYDRRRGKAVNLLKLDLTKLRAAIGYLDSTGAPVLGELGKPLATRDSTKAIGNLEPADWTGIVYLEVTGAPVTTIAGATTAATITAATTTAVELINGNVHLASFGSANPGLTVASNTHVYVKGSYNADGTTVATSANAIETGEVPAAIAADAITLLSPGFVESPATTSSLPTASAQIEIAAALLMGNVPTDKNNSNSSSGGVHNFPRFLESWSGKAVWIRGSLVCLFESRVASEPFVNATIGTGYYGAPTRNFGFNDLFRGGTFPPGTPRVLSYRRVDFTDLTPARYATLKSALGL